jgi:hypothetical protein
MNPTILKFSNGSTRAYIYHINKFRIEIRHPHSGATLGWYNPSNNVTYSSNGMIGFGDLLTTLL